MAPRLYVGNLPEDVSAEALRRRFAQHGAVADVHMAIDRSSGRSRGYAFVTMASGEDARVAMDRLDGAMFEHRALRVNAAGADRDELAPRTKQARRGVQITSQFRERQNMTYELCCGGMTLAIRVFPLDRAEESWRMEASTTDAVGHAMHVTTAAHSTRTAALQELARSWGQGPGSAANAIDWPEVMEALGEVRAI
jgi:RNA recognition motif. (a.k.a. RRM, RBD, or RNP domain)